jgi:predicted GH43/DUF377 family glycosyl hydrolase
MLGASLVVGAAEFPGLEIGAVPTTAKFSDPDYQIWGASMVEGDDGKFHLFYSRWPAELGHRAWVSHSEIAHAVSDQPGGPYRHVGVTLPARGDDFWDGDCTHNPTIHRFDGKYHLYYMGTVAKDEAKPGTLSMAHRNNQRIGVAVADSPDGPWKRSDAPLIDVGDENAHDAIMVSNPSVVKRPEGGYQMVYKAVAKKLPAPRYGPVVHLTATSDSPVGPFTKQNKPVFTAEGSEFPAEDPYVWNQGDRYFAIVKDMRGNFTQAGQSLALFESRDGFDWSLSKKPLVSRLEIPWSGREPQKVSALERPQLWLHNGRPEIMFCAVAIDKKRAGTFNVAIPLVSQK